MNRKETTTELTVTEWVDNDHLRIVADSHGIGWDTVFTVAPHGDLTVLTMNGEARATRLLPRIMTFLIRGMWARAVAQDLDTVKIFCEGGKESQLSDKHSFHPQS